jgi:hypothetical protein
MFLFAYCYADEYVVFALTESFPAKGCHQDGDVPKSPFNNRQPLPSVGKISI